MRETTIETWKKCFNIFEKHGFKLKRESVFIGESVEYLSH